MFLLSELSSEGKKFALQEEETYAVGRDNGNIMLSDNSVSRKHATITVKQNEVTLTDLNSSNGTLINSVPVTPNKEYRISLEANIQFGMNTKFRLEKADLIVTCSALSSDQKQMIAELMKKQGVEIMSEWSNRVTHVVSSGSAVTKKIICALIKGQPLVQIGFFQERWRCIQNSKPLPREADFILRKLESQCPVDINYNCIRATLFAHKLFIFNDDKEKSKNNDIVVMCGGKTVSASTFSERGFKEDIQCLLVLSGAEVPIKQMQKLVERNKRLGQRVIPAQEISAAVITGDTQYFCNSRCKIVQRLTSGAQELKKGEVLVADTETYRDGSVLPAGSTMININKSESGQQANAMEIETSEIENPMISVARGTRGTKRHNESDKSPSETMVVPKSKKFQLKRPSKQTSVNNNITATFAKIGLDGNNQVESVESFTPMPKVSLSEVNIQKTQSPKLRLKRGANDKGFHLQQSENVFPMTPREETVSTNTSFSSPKGNAPPSKRKLTLKRKIEESPKEDVCQKRPVRDDIDNSTRLKNSVLTVSPGSSSVTSLASKTVNVDQTSNVSLVSAVNSTINRTKQFRKQKLIHYSSPNVTISSCVSKEGYGL